MGLVAMALAIYYLTNWQKRANMPEIDVVLVGKFIFVFAGIFGTILFAVLYWTSVYWTLLFKVSISACNH